MTIVRNDPLSREERSIRMSLVPAKDSKPEIRVRALLRSLGFRHESHARDLPGCPDIVFRKKKKVILVHGCFWHRHKCPMGNRTPRSRVAFWQRKLEGNKNRDAVVRRELKKSGWSVLVVWECQTAPKKLQRLARRAERFLRM
jgi:DNA mismatch endonuclease (patch repair protein)